MDPLDQLVRSTLADGYVDLRLVHYVMTEYVAPAPRCHVALTLRRDGVQRTVEAQGSGFLEAAFRGLTQHVAPDAALGGLRVVGFTVDGHMASSRDAKGLDALARVRVEVQPPEGPAEAFEAEARSTLAASLLAVVRVAERALNVGLAARRLQAGADEARVAGRMDALARSRERLAVLRPWLA
ncbi:MAG: hypothetical protein H6706_23415 [Myxococcales bacterium]|nr:hypothetical protein [Myxococcales bacterium]